MPVTVQLPGYAKTESPIERLLGLVGGIQQMRQRSQQADDDALKRKFLEQEQTQKQEDRDRKKAGTFYPGEILSELDNFERVAPTDEGAFPIKVQRGDVMEEWGLKPRPKTSPLADIAAGLGIVKTKTELADRNDKKAKEEAERRVVGFDAAPGYRPTDDDIKVIKKLNQNYLEGSKSIDKLTALVQQHGTAVAPGPVKNEMARLVTSLQLKIKDIAGLGQISKSDEGLLTNMVADPTKWTTAVTLEGGGVINGLEGLRGTFKDTLSSAAEAHGFVPSAGNPGFARAPQGPPTGGGGQTPPSNDKMVPVTSPDGKPGMIPAANLERALQRGYQQR
jgi:hypothetical protein